MENVLLKECIYILNLKTIFTEKIAEKIFHDFEKKLIFSNYGLIDKEKNKYLKINNLIELAQIINKETLCYIIWDNESLPIIKTNFDNILRNLDDVLCVHYDTWIWIESENKVVEFNNNDEILIFNYT